ncbi:DUF2752 domain-containing protein [Vulcanococcus limneticus Candia 3F8]|nr:DUF2752 domain-containing protein [Vulcanococcus limneticus]MCP9792196.1 DUF2752 domain-containing protein [Vulcanococcus limneticus MW73D5]MCP9894432.1 DUF2752 domain-containing protein [Vulcanococcus limneticus Candia 3F8]MCP9897613.1 DUF2752 domain-containing protein [Vulcanococcus limneticus Candia 3B3]
MRRAGVLLPASLTGYLWLKGGHPGLPGFACPLRALTGIPCPTCFLTRATAASLRGDFGEALALHAFGPLAAAALLVWSVQAIRRRRLYPQGLQAWHVVAASLGLLAYWGLRMGLSYGLGLAAFPSG